MRKVSTSHAVATIVVVGLDSDQMGLVRETLAAEAVLPSASVDFPDAMSMIRRSRPDVVIVDYSERQEESLELAQQIQKGTTNITKIALAKKSDAPAILAAMRVGYKEYVVLPDDANRLRQVVRDAAFSAAEEENKGLVVCMVGAKGGVGTTLLSTHLAAELVGIHRVCLIDLDFGMGDVASMMDLTIKDTIADLLPRASRLDERSLVASMVVHRTRVHVLTTPNDIDSIGEVNADDIYNIINAAAQGYQFVILDCGIYLDEAVAMALNVADLVVLISTPDVLSIRGAFRRLNLLERIGVETTRARLVINRYVGGGFVSLADIKENLGIPVVATIAEDTKTVNQAVNEGKLIREINRNSDTARDIATLVGVLTEDSEGTLPSEETPKKGFFASLFGGG